MDKGQNLFIFVMWQVHLLSDEMHYAKHLSSSSSYEATKILKIYVQSSPNCGETILDQP